MTILALVTHHEESPIADMLAKFYHFAAGHNSIAAFESALANG